MLFTKSIQDEKSEKDGIRICIMRRIKPEFEFDIWMPNLAPSTKLLKKYHDEKIDWKGFEKNFKKEMSSQQIYFEIVKEIVEKNNATILCWEPKDENCHRLIVAENLKELNPKFKIRNV